MSLPVVRRLLLGVAVAVTPVILLADQSRPPAKPATADLATARPGRDPNQPIDEEYTRKIKEYTTETFFLSPLVDYLPASKTVPTPKAVLGDIAGAPGKLPMARSRTISLCTRPRRQKLMLPEIFVKKEKTRLVPTALATGIPPRTRIGVSIEPLPNPVRPIRNPMNAPVARMSKGFKGSRDATYSM